MKFSSLTLSILCLLTPLHIFAELLIVKKVGDTMVPLDESDLTAKITNASELPAEIIKENNLTASDIIEDILLKYQWPMVVASKLTKEEQDALLTKDKPYAEEQFIEAKIREETKRDDLHVVFIPTTIYELFVMVEALKTNDQENPLQNAFKEFTHTKKELLSEDLFRLLISKGINNTEAINNNFKSANELFFKENKAYWYINQKLSQTLFASNELFKKTTRDSSELRSKIEQQSTLLINTFIQQLNSQILRRRLSIHEYEREKLVKKISTKVSIALIENITKIEYEIQRINKALLIRGTSFVPFEIKKFGKKDDTPTLLAGNTLQEPKDLTPEEKQKTSFYKYTFKPYSIAFGNSLFAGAFRDPAACAYNFLTEYVNQSIQQLEQLVGYVLFIDKHDYMCTRISNLFFIAPLCTLAALFAEGEFFHSRSTAAIKIKTNEFGEEVEGISPFFRILDPTGIFLITRNPLKHAALFSDFLAKNGRIIQLGDEKDLTPEEKQFIETMQKNQTDAAQYYRAIETLGRWAPKVTLQYKKDFAKKKEAEQSTLEAKIDINKNKEML